MGPPDTLATRQAENARMIVLLENQGNRWRMPNPVAVVVQGPESPRLSTAKNVALLRRLFRGRIDVYPIDWESKTSGKAAYSPACANTMTT